MDAAKAARTAARRSFTRTANEIDQLLTAKEPNLGDLRDSLTRLEQVLEEIQGYDLTVRQHILETVPIDEAALDTEQSVIDVYEKRFIKTRRKVRDITDDEKRGNRPKAVTEWLPFWSQFKKNHEDEELDDADKFQYLVQCMTPGTEAADLMDTFPQSVNGSPQNVSFSKMFDRFSAQLQALETLGVSSDQMLTFLYPIVESTLPEDVLTAWQRSPNWGKDGSTMRPPQTDLQLLLDFLKLEAQCEDQRQLVHAGFQIQRKPERKANKNVTFQKEDGPTASGLFAASMNLENRKKVVTEKKACYACLKTEHGSRNCKAVVKCAFCQRRHSSMLCLEVEKNQSVPESTSKLTPSQITPSMSNMQCSGDVILQTVFVNLENNGVRRRVRLVFDGCHRSYLLKSTAVELGLKTAGTVKICGLLPRTNKQNVIEDLKQKKIFVNDVGEDSPEVEVLIGADNFASLLTGKRKSLRCDLIALETAYGWTLTGELRKYESNNTSLMVCTSMMAKINVTNLWDLELIGIREPALHKSQAEKDTEAQQHFLRTVPNNFDAAKKRLDGTLRRLKSTNMVEQYNKISRDWILEGIVEVAPAEERNNRGHYLPHRRVVKPGSLTTPVRPVFDALCKTGRTPSLNDCLAKGPNLIEFLPSVLNRFRCGNIGVSADIRKRS
ncbi:uncharacterized protein [Polyergus mexicanus]|uniref:uncharacterized protein n=1 Tax=Polyergus mexicanus TaxID=615972 RepID=UPI0038B65951